MKYATWKLHFENGYFTGPEKKISDLGGSAEAAYSNGDITDGATILGYFDGEVTGLEKWEFAEINQSQALEFALALGSDAYVTETGKIMLSYND